MTSEAGNRTVHLFEVHVIWESSLIQNDNLSKQMWQVSYMGDLEHVNILLQSLQAQNPKPRNRQSNMPLKDSRNACVCVSTPDGS